MSNDEVRPKGNSAKAGVVMQTGDPNASISGKKSCAAMSALGRLKIALMPRIETVARRISRSSFKVASISARDLGISLTHFKEQTSSVVIVITAIFSTLIRWPNLLAAVSHALNQFLKWVHPAVVHV